MALWVRDAHGPLMVRLSFAIARRE